jgi:DNA-binding response OmpR family regulator
VATVLVVDDDPDLRDLAAIKLGRAGHAVITAEDGYQALAVADTARVDVVVMDVTMPGLSGVDVVRRLRAMPAMRPVPVIMVTARTGDAAVEEAFAAGADEYLTKPYRPAELADRVAALLARRAPSAAPTA